MVDTLEPYNLALTEMVDDIPAILKEVFLKRGADIVRMIQEQQLSKGKDGDGFLLGTYSIVTQNIATTETPKPIRPKIYGKPYNFEWTGDWFKKMKAQLQGTDGYEIFSADWKHNLLIEKYGPDLVKINDRLNQYINDVILKWELHYYFVNRLSNVA